MAPLNVPASEGGGDVPTVSASIMAADFAALGAAAQAAAAAGADLLHIDVMDGRFVPNITVGPDVVRCLGRVTSLPLEVHLMIVEPWHHLDAFRAAGASRLIVHVEACPHLHRVVSAIRNAGAGAGVALNPHTPPSVLDYILGELDLALVMSVNPGFGGQDFIPFALDKLSRLRRAIDRLPAGSRRPLLEIDGGVGPDNASDAARAGADILVAGTALFCAPDMGAAVAALKSAPEGSVRR